MDLRSIAVPDAAPGGQPAPPARRGEGPPSNAPTHRRSRSAPEESDADNDRLERARDQLRATDAFAHRRKILHLKSWASTFPDECGQLVASNDLEHMSDAQIDVLQQEVEFAVGAKSNSIVTGAVAGSALKLGEDWVASMGYEVKGPKLELNQLATAKDFQYLVKELTLRHAEIVYQNPWIRAAAYMMNAIKLMDNANREAKAAQVGEKRKEPDPTPGAQQVDNGQPPAQRPRLDEPPPSMVIAEIPANHAAPAMPLPGGPGAPLPPAPQQRPHVTTGQTVVPRQLQAKPAPAPQVHK